ncbi:hypothetical protein EC973_004316 [Apophysomyces ossiformis]|uniref:Uncharacterized protein n=1 Tax=Apophysomyces ossiformis TaxID=679940 RepID=A0A8H7BLF0_9FUNG|nr:hypothetical protein EC973_004316 [Apophysomyces ossiformis]
MSYWSFDMDLEEDAHRLPPSFCAGRHRIEYELSARLTLGSFAEKVKLGYLLVPSILTLNNKEREQEEHQPLVKKNRGSYFGVCCPIQVIRWTDRKELGGGWEHYRGSRVDHISYKVSLPSWISENEDHFTFICGLYPHRLEANVTRLQILLEQIERYPIEPCKIHEDLHLEVDVMRTRIIKINETERVIDRTIDSLDDLKISVLMGKKHSMAPEVHTISLEIKHQLRLVVHFGDARTERPMSLSFPIKVGHIRKSSYTPNHSVLPTSLSSNIN